VAVTTLAGVTHRIGELLEVLQNFSEKTDTNMIDKSDNNLTDKHVNFGYDPSPQSHGKLTQNLLIKTDTEN